MTPDHNWTTKDAAFHGSSQSDAPNLNMLDVVKSGDFVKASKSSDFGESLLPQGFHVAEMPSTAVPQRPAGEEQHGNTTTQRDAQGNVKEYANADYTLSKHDDGKWYYHQNGDGHDYVEVDGGSIKMDAQGAVTYNESGMFGKNNQILGHGSSGFLSSLSSAAENVAEHPLDTINSITFAPIAAVDAITGTHAIKAIGDLEKGAADEVIHHPGEIVKDVAIGAAIGVATVATGGGALVALGLGAAAFGASELLKNKGDVGGVINDVKGYGESVANWGRDFATVAGSGQHSADEQQAAEQGLKQAGAFGAQTIAGAAGGIAGGFGASVAGLERSIPIAIKSVSNRELPNVAEKNLSPSLESQEVLPALEQHTHPFAFNHYLLKDGSRVYEDLNNRIVQHPDGSISTSPVGWNSGMSRLRPGDNNIYREYSNAIQVIRPDGGFSAFKNWEEALNQVPDTEPNGYFIPKARYEDEFAYLNAAKEAVEAIDTAGGIRFPDEYVRELHQLQENPPMRDGLTKRVSKPQN